MLSTYVADSTNLNEDGSMKNVNGVWEVPHLCSIQWENGHVRNMQAKAARLPSLGLTGSFGGSSDALSSLLDPANLAWQAGTSLLVPIFDGGARKQEVKVATAEQEQALAAYGVTAQTAFSEVESALDQGTLAADDSAKATILGDSRL